MGMDAIAAFHKTIGEIAALREVEEPKMLDPIGEGKWAIREIIGHLHYWDKFILERHIPFMASGAALEPFPDHDSYNSEGITYINRFSNAGAIIDEFVATRNLLLEAISTIKRDIRFTIGSGKRQFAIDGYISIFAKHDIHHLEQIKNKLSITISNT